MGSHGADVRRVRYRYGDELLDAVAIKHEQWDYPAHLSVIDQRVPAVIEHNPAALETDGDDGVTRVDGEIAHDDQLHVLSSDSCLRKCNVFRDGVILAIAKAGRERRERCGPPV